MSKPFERMAVIGTGVLGTQIAMVSAYAGYDVNVYDAAAASFDATIAKLSADLKAKGMTPFIPWDKWDECKKKIRFGTDLARAIEDVDFIVEAITEDVEMKRKLFKEMGQLAPAKTIFATNSSSLPVSRMEDGGARPERCINTHFYQPLYGMIMTDLMPGTKTLPEVLQKGEEWIRSLGIIPLRVKRRPWASASTVSGGPLRNKPSPCGQTASSISRT